MNDNLNGVVTITPSPDVEWNHGADYNPAPSIIAAFVIFILFLGAIYFVANRSSN